MEIALTNWKHLFQNWPQETPRRGILVTKLNEQIPFSGFLVSEAFLLAQRQTPDSLGARTVILPYEEVAVLKFVDVVKSAVFGRLGFEGKLPSQ